MKKRFVFLLVLLLVVMGSTLTALAENTETPLGGVISEKIVTSEKNIPPEKIIPSDITSPGGIDYFTDKFADLFFDQDKASEQNFLISVAANRDLKANDPLRFILNGSVRLDSDIEKEADDTVIVLLYIKRDGKFVPLNTVDAKINKDTNLVETPLLLYAKVKLDNLGNDKVNELRVIAFCKSQLKGKLEMDKNVQITDMKVVARTYTVMDRVRIGFSEVTSIFQNLK